MDLPSFLWLWQTAAWSMGLVALAYTMQAISGAMLSWQRRRQQPRPPWLRPLHYSVGIVLVLLVLLLLGIGIVGTLGHYGSLGHSPHLAAGVSVVGLVLLSAWSAMQIGTQRPWARSLHVGTNAVLLLGLAAVLLTGWDVVQQYLD
ncbi:MAG: DUF4079 domain-containing protein [Cyanobacteria bacterium QS_8_64_29]|nr:MAG: DUF4079 domain-containing protein [Cyanobacteria bacterium QS_8_64_29]